jgi:hypothetical protein
MEEINKYLAEIPSLRRFSEGVELYEKHGESTVLKGFFKIGESAFSREKLFKSLNDILAFNQPKILTKTEKFEAIKQKKEERQLLPSDMPDAPDDVASIRNRRKQLYVTRSNLFSQLKLMVHNEDKFTDEQRGKISNQIVKLGVEIENIWKSTSYYDIHKTLPPQPKNIVIECNSDLELMKRLNSTRAKISQAKAGKRSDKDLPELIQERDYLEKLIEEIEVDVTIKE